MHRQLLVISRPHSRGTVASGSHTHYCDIITQCLHVLHGVDHHFRERHAQSGTATHRSGESRDLGALCGGFPGCSSREEDGSEDGEGVEDVEGAQVAVDAGAQREAQDTLVALQLQPHREKQHHNLEPTVPQVQEKNQLGSPTRNYSYQ